MTQERLKALSILSLCCLALVVFDWLTLLCLLTTSFFILAYLKQIIRKQLSRGLIHLLP
jgi:hypothetical protein